jgi:hypothetical protein
MNTKIKVRQLQAVLTEEEMAALKAAVLKAGMKQKYWLRKLVLDAIKIEKDRIERQGGIS